MIIDLELARKTLGRIEVVSEQGSDEYAQAYITSEGLVIDGPFTPQVRLPWVVLDRFFRDPEVQQQLLLTGR